MRNPYPRWLRALFRRVLTEAAYRRRFTCHDTFSLAVWQELAAAVSASRGVLDVGAYHGTYALAAHRANPAVPVYAFEPAPGALAVLREAVAGTGVEVEPLAVTNWCGTAEFVAAHRDGPAGNRLAYVIERELRPEEEVVRAEVTTLDGWASERGVRPALVKVDVEGAEPDVIAGATETLAEHRPVLICEVLNEGAGRRLEAALPPDFAFVRICERGWLDPAHSLVPQSWQDRNWIVYPREHPALDVEAVLAPFFRGRQRRLWRLAPSRGSGPSVAEEPLP